MAIIDDIKNRQGETVYPRTLLSAVYDGDTNKNLDEILFEKKVEVFGVKDFVSTDGDKRVTLKWEDPEDKTITNDSGEVMTIAKWEGTKILRKVGSYPQNENDGVLVVDSGIRNQYSTSGFVDTGVINDTTYYYMAFPYTSNMVYTIDFTSRVVGKPNNDDDKTGSPGPRTLIAGNMSAGYFGTVSARDFMTGNAVAIKAGINEGVSQFNNTDWLKFAYNNTIIFKSIQPIRHTISHYQLEQKGCVNGTTTIEDNGCTYKVRLMRGAGSLTADINSPDRGAIGSEWNKLMLPITTMAKDHSFYRPEYVEEIVPYWGIDFTSEELHTTYTSGNGFIQWCQENRASTYRVTRGGGGVSNAGQKIRTEAGTGFGWSPVLEVVP